VTDDARGNNCGFIIIHPSFKTKRRIRLISEFAEDNPFPKIADADPDTFFYKLFMLQEINGNACEPGIESVHFSNSSSFQSSPRHPAWEFVV